MIVRFFCLDGECNGKMKLSSYIGATDQQNESNWGWIDGSAWESTFWGKNQPDNDGGKEDCGFIEIGTWAGNPSPGWLNDIPCERVRYGGYICSYTVKGKL